MTVKMKFHNLLQLFSFIVGFAIALLTTCCFQSFNSYNNGMIGRRHLKELANVNLTDYLKHKVKILCLVITQPAFHRSKAAHVRNTWGRKCNKLIFLSTENDTVTETFVLEANESRSILWAKVRNGFERAYEKYLRDYDWFLKCDDDSYFVMENLRRKLYQYNANTSILIGHKYCITGLNDGYMAGGGYVMSRKALKKLVENNFKDPEKCLGSDSDGSEDAELGRCLQNDALLIDAHDFLGEKEFFPVSVEEHLQHEKPDPSYWYTTFAWFNATRGGLKCCSKYLANLHYVNPQEMDLLEYLIYEVYPYGWTQHTSEHLPEKLSFQKVKQLADEKSDSPNFCESISHNFDSDETF